MRRLPLSLLACCLVGAARPPQQAVHYAMSPEIEAGELHALDVEIRFAGDSDGTTELAWPEHWAGESKLAQWTRDVRVDGATSVEEAVNGTRVIHAAPGAPLVVRYRIVSAYDHDPGVDEWEQQSWPIVRQRWFYAAGEALFAAPVDRNDAPATFEWRGAPAGFGFASDLEQLAPSSTVNDMIESMVIGGYGLKVTDRGAGVRMATIGSYAFDPDALGTVASRVIAAERDFWGTDRNAPFLVTMAPLKASKTRQSFSGTGRGDAFAMWVGEDIPMPMLTWLLGHEYFHGWNPARLGGLPDGAGEAQGFWFSEGFTDFYARRLLVRAGLITPQEFADQWNEALLRYATSPFRTAPNGKAAANFWSDADAQKLPYDRGSLLAALWDHRLRSANGGKTSLDAVMHRQLRMMVGKPVDRAPYAAEAFVRSASQTGLDVRPDIARYVTRGAMVLLPAHAFGPCATVHTQRRPVFDRGFETTATTSGGNIVSGVRPDSAAFAAGLRKGMKIVKRVSGRYGDSTTDYVLRVDDNGAERLIRFRPAGRSTVVAQQLKLNSEFVSRQPKMCAATLSGLGT